MTIQDIINDLQVALDIKANEMVALVDNFQDLSRDRNAEISEITKVFEEMVVCHESIQPFLEFIKENSEFAKEATRGYLKFKVALEKKRRRRKRIETKRKVKC